MVACLRSIPSLGTLPCGVTHGAKTIINCFRLFPLPPFSLLKKSQPKKELKNETQKG
jgi:hypothetical protein